MKKQYTTIETMYLIRKYNKTKILINVSTIEKVRQTLSTTPFERLNMSNIINDTIKECEEV